MAKVKGTQMFELVKSLRAQRDAARAAMPDRLHNYLDSRILPSVWYSEEDFHELLRTLAAILPPRDGDPWEFIGDFAGRTQFASVYQAFVKARTPVYSLQRFAAVWRLMHDTGHAECSVQGHGKAWMRIRGYEHGTLEYARTLGAFLRRLLILAGASDAEYRLLGSDWSKGWELTWTE